MEEKIGLGVIGCGDISDIYLKNCKDFEILDIVACADKLKEKAVETAKKYDIPRVCDVSELLSMPRIDIVLNLTPPQVHARISNSALAAGKHIYTEKPFAVTRHEGREILQKADNNNLLVGCAPDTFLGAGLQTCRKLIVDDWIGRPIGATAFMMGTGPESWHPDPAFYYKKGVGPMFDMGPYYLTALISLIGSIKRITGATGKPFSERLITSEAKYGEKIKVEVPTHVNGLLEFKEGAVGTIITSCDIKGTQLPWFEIYGTKGTLSGPDPNTFGGPVKIKRGDHDGWQEFPLVNKYSDNSRGLGVVDMAYAIRDGGKPRAGGKMDYHVLDVMAGIHEAADTGEHIQLESTCEQPLPVNYNEEIPEKIFSRSSIND